MRMVAKYYIEGHIRNVNKAVFNKLKPVMTQEHSNFLPFLDLQGMASEQNVLETLSLDGVHMKAVWYEIILSALVETLCESDLTLLFGQYRLGTPVNSVELLPVEFSSLLCV